MKEHEFLSTLRTPRGATTEYRATFNHAPNEPARLARLLFPLTLLFALTKLIAGSYALYVH